MVGAEAGGEKHLLGGEVVTVAFGDDLFEAPVAEGVVGHGAHGLGGVAVVLMLGEEADAELGRVVVGEGVEDAFADEFIAEVEAKVKLDAFGEVGTGDFKEPSVAGVALTGPGGAPVPAPETVARDVAGKAAVGVDVGIGDGLDEEALGDELRRGFELLDDAAGGDGVFCRRGGWGCTGVWICADRSRRRRPRG